MCGAERFQGCCQSRVEAVKGSSAGPNPNNQQMPTERKLWAGMDILRRWMRVSDLNLAIFCLLTCCGSLFQSWDDTTRPQLWPVAYCPAGRANPGEPMALPAAVVHFGRRSHEAGHLGRYFDATKPAFGIVHGLLVPPMWGPSKSASNSTAITYQQRTEPWYAGIQSPCA
jgi:hypothetical protein